MKLFSTGRELVGIWRPPFDNQRVVVLRHNGRIDITLAKARSYDALLVLCMCLGSLLGIACIPSSFWVWVESLYCVIFNCS
jgi:hypothetical protein